MKLTNQSEQAVPFEECVQYLFGFFILSQFVSQYIYLSFNGYQEKHLQEASPEINSSPALPAFVQIVELIFMNNALHP